MGKHLGVTGTRKGMTEQQKAMLATLLAVCRTTKGFTHFHDGDCIGVDVEARRMAYYDHLFYCIVHPSRATTRAFAPFRHEMREPKAPLDRNRDIIDESDLVIGCPSQDQEILRSGTWAALRYTGKAKKRTIIITPSGWLLLYPEGYRSVLRDGRMADDRAVHVASEGTVVVG